MADPKPETLSDHELRLEVTNTARRLHAARAEFQRRRYSLNDEDWEALDQAIHKIERHFRFCIAEQSRRETAATFVPKIPRRQRTLVKKGLADPGAPAGGFAEPKGPAVIVYDRNGPRRWRKGDPIY